MGVRLTSQESKVALYDSVTDQAFGTVFDSEEEAELFLTWYQGTHGDPRSAAMWGTLDDAHLFYARYGEWARATRDVNTGEFRTDIAIQMARDAS